MSRHVSHRLCWVPKDDWGVNISSQWVTKLFVRTARLLQVFFTLSCTPYAYSSNYLILKTSHWFKVLNETIWDFFLAHVCVFLKGVIFNSKVFKIAAWQQRYSKCKSENTILAKKLKITSTKIEILPQKIFLSDLVKTKLNLYVFESISWKFSSTLCFQRNMYSDLEGLKHLNTWGKNT